METIVLKQSDAIEWLNKEARNLVADFEDSSYTAKDVADIVEDLLEDIELIKDKDWEWVAIEECAMSPSNINVYEMKRA